MSTEERKVPELRFNGFNDDWEQRAISSKYSVTMGHSPSGENYTSNPKDHILVQGNADISNGWVSPRVWTTQVTKLIEPGNILLSVRAPVGQVGKTLYPVVIGRGIASLDGDEFVFQLLKRMQLNNYWRKVSTGSTFESISSKDINNALIKLPIESERESIGEFLKSLDSYTELHQRKHKALQEIIKAYKQQIFNQKLIFKCVDGFYERNWKNYKFSNFMSKYTTLERAEDIKKNQLLSVKLFGKGVEVANQNRALKLGSTVYYKRSYGDFIYGKQNFFNGAFGFVPKSLDGYYSSGDVPSLKFDSGKVDRDFFIHFINRESFYKRAEIYASGTGSKRIHENTLLDFEVCFPSINSQIEIGKFFRNLDEIVYQNLIILEKLESTKKEYLNKMFI